MKPSLKVNNKFGSLEGKCNKTINHFRSTKLCIVQFGKLHFPLKIFNILGDLQKFVYKLFKIRWVDKNRKSVSTSSSLSLSIILVIARFSLWHCNHLSRFVCHILVKTAELLAANTFSIEAVLFLNQKIRLTGRKHFRIHVFW